MGELKSRIIQALAGKHDITTVPQIAALVQEPVGMSLLEALYQLREDGFINWRPGKFIHLSRTGYEVLRSE
jgi:hypothetical protein